MIVTLLFALVATMVLLVLLRPVLARFDMLDVPSERSSHTVPVLRGGGLAIVLGACAAIVANDIVTSRPAFVLLAVSAAFALVGFADDYRSRSVKLRLAAQVALASLAAIVLAMDFDLEPLVAVGAAGLTAFWIIAYVNVFNFMDGINGITAVTAAIVGVTHMVGGTQIDSDVVAIGGAALLGSAIGFLPFNFPVARVFAGDVGSYFLGSYIAILSVVALTAGASLVLVVAPLMMYIADTSHTLGRRVLNGKKISEAHNDHSYQYLANRRLTHVRTTLLVALLTAVCAGLGLLSQDRSTALAVVLFVAIVVIASIFVWLPTVFVDRRSVRRSTL